MPRDAQPQPPSPTLELASLSPDSPLRTPISTAPQPRWALPSRTLGQHLVHTIHAACKAVLRRARHLSWPSALLSALLIYTIACITLSVPPFASRLPAYTGPHAVGAMDLEVPLPQPQLIADPVFKHSLAPAFELQTVLVTIFYPASKTAQSPNKPLPWMPRPIRLTAQGYARLLHADNMLTRPLLTFALWLIAGTLTIPAQVDVPLAPSPARLPLVLFSHGMAASPTDYTNYLGELASRGTIVAAIHHRDGSSPATHIRAPGLPAQPRLLFREADLVASPSNHSPVDTPSLKRHQLAFRDAEIFQTIRLLRHLDAGAFIPSTLPPPESLPSFASRLDFTTLVTAGHSYGATSALQALRPATDPDARPNPSTAGLALDPGKQSGPLNAAVNVPLLVVHSNAWSKQHTIFFGRPHFDTVRDLVAGVLNRTAAAWFLTSLGTGHASVTDAPLIEPLLLSWVTGTTLHAKEALGEYVRLSNDFIASLRADKARGVVLQQEVTHTQYNKWVSQEREKAFPKALARLWEIHVSPASSNNFKT